MDSSRLVCRFGDVPGLSGLLARHPRVTVAGGTTSADLEFVDGGRRRSVRTGCTDGVFGLLELMDNNPLVCADEVGVPDTLSTLAAIALAPLIRAGLLFEKPVVISGDAGSTEEVERTLFTLGWHEGVTLQTTEAVLPCAAATVMAIVICPDDLDDLDDLYDEAYGRSFFVRRDEVSEWVPELVLGRPHAAFRLSLTPGGARCLLTIRVLADFQGKCGAAQIVHAMNLMAGFEETLGLEAQGPTEPR
jgi:N-acetyl-gamma-glutamylphosphate reductase